MELQSSVQEHNCLCPHTLRKALKECLKITSQMQYTWIFISESQNWNKQQWY